MKGLGLAGPCRQGLTLAAAIVPSLSSDSSLLLSESSSTSPIWTLTAAEPAFPGQGGWAPFPDAPRLTVEAALTWELFPKGFICERQRARSGEDTLVLKRGSQSCLGRAQGSWPHLGNCALGHSHWCLYTVAL